MKVKEEVVKQYSAEFLEVVDFPEWLANIVLVPKEDGNEWMCVDYRYMTKSVQKMIPSPTHRRRWQKMGHAMFSSMDGFSAYN